MVSMAYRGEIKLVFLQSINLRHMAEPPPEKELFLRHILQLSPPASAPSGG